MKVEILSRRDESELAACLRRLTLLNSTVEPYARADIGFATVPTDFVHPAAFYVSRVHFERQRELRDALLEQGVDPLDLRGSVEFRCDDGVRTLIPPVVEFQRERIEYHPLRADDLRPPPIELELPLVNDGLHRVYLARQLGIPVRVITVRGAEAAHPYYAYPAGWSRVELVDQVPQDKHKRKFHRTANYYALYRDFGPLGVGEPRHPNEIKR